MPSRSPPTSHCLAERESLPQMHFARWHHFTPGTFDIGRELLALDGAISIGLSDAPRCIIDAFRTRATEGHELGYEALRRWLCASGSQPGQLIRLAGQFPKAETPLRMALAALL
jgi:hypothetical protein